MYYANSIVDAVQLTLRRIEGRSPLDGREKEDWNLGFGYGKPDEMGSRLAKKGLDLEEVIEGVPSMSTC